MIKLNVYSAKGVKKPAVVAPKSMQEKENLFLLSQAIRVYEDRRHPGLNKVKTRGEVALSTRKIYRQKGTGGARHGAKSAPIFVGGGVAHGPKGIKRELSLPRLMRKKALNIALGLKAKKGQLVVLDSFSSLKKTKEAATLIEKISKDIKNLDKNSKFTFALAEENRQVQAALRNIKNVEVVPFRDLNVYRVFYSGVLVIDKSALDKTNDKGKEIKVAAPKKEVKKVK
jgi:large subunit ribosomal protein L4